jgi:LPXTG-motif cell wall-anchored protein
VLTTKAYTITENDGRVGRVLNDASIAAVSPTGADVSDFANNTVPVEGGGVVTPAAAALPQTGATVETLFWAALALLIGGALTLIIRHRPEGV